MNALQFIDKKYAPTRAIPQFKAGDHVRIHVKIKEGDKERVQVFEGTVIQIHRAGVSTTFTVRKISYGVGVERIFPIYSPVISQIEVVSIGKVRRSRLYYLRKLSGKKARIFSVEEKTTFSPVEEGQPNEPVPVAAAQ